MKRSFESALAAEQHGRRSYELTYSTRVRFSGQVAWFIDTFGRENVPIIIFDDCKSNTAVAYRNTLDFLDVRSDLRTSFPVLNANPRARSNVLCDAMRNPPRRLRSIIRLLTSQYARARLGRLLIRLNVVREERPPIAPELSNRLKPGICA
jgi:hypothetical protein